MTKKNPGKIFEQCFQTSCEKLGLFHDRIKDAPPTVKVGKNKFDYYLYLKPHLFTLELKSTSNKSISFAENIIRKHQIENLIEASKHDGVISGFIFNFRTEDANDTYFINIEDFERYKNIAENGLDHTYKNKVNTSSIPIGICKEIGLKINNYKKITNYHYNVREFIEQAIEKYGNRTS